MREFTFAIEYDRGADPIMDVFIDYPDLIGFSIDGYVTTNQFWRIERFTGPSAALNRIEELRFDDSECGESITATDCQATRYHDILERSRGERVIYTQLTDIQRCESVHTLAGRFLSSGVVFETQRHEDRHSWRILLQSDEKIGMLYDALGAMLRDGLAFRMGHLRDVDSWQQNTLGTVSMPHEQRTALQAAVEAGYYETPREASLDEISADLDIPRSTLSYRLRQAEAQLVFAFVEDQLSPYG